MDMNLEILNGKMVRVFLHRLNRDGNNYTYSGKVIDAGVTSICILDKFNKLQVIEGDEIARVEEVE